MAENKRDLVRICDQLTNGQISIDEWAKKFDAALLDGHLDALILGFERAGNFDYDLKELKELARGIKDTESEFLTGYTDDAGVWHRGWIGDLKSGDDPRYFDKDGNLVPGSLDNRADLYVGRMRGTANEAFVNASDPDSSFEWELGDTEHCDDCLEMADGGPYTVDTLFSFPGDGGTQCLGNCGCTLTRDDGVEGFGHHNDEDSDGETEGNADERSLDQPELPLLPDDEARTGGNGGTPMNGEPDDPEDGPPSQFSIADSLLPDEAMKPVLGTVAEAMDELVMMDVSSPGLFELNDELLKPGNLGLCNVTDKKITLDLSQGQSRHATTLIHEIGHFLDAIWLTAEKGAMNIGSGEFASDKKYPELKKWFKAVSNSESVKNLKQMATDPRLSPYQRSAIKGYYLDPAELWARCFTQYIGTKTSSETVSKEWNSLYNEGEAKLIHWTEEDFKLIAKEMDQIFEARGWLVK